MKCTVDSPDAGSAPRRKNLRKALKFPWQGWEVYCVGSALITFSGNHRKIMPALFGFEPIPQPRAHFHTHTKALRKTRISFDNTTD